MLDLAASLSFILFHLTPATFLFLGLMVWSSPQKAPYARLWTIFCFLTAITWSCALVTTLYLSTVPAADFASRLALCFGASCTLAYYAFYLSFLQLLEKYKRRLIIASIYTVCLIGFFLFSTLFQQTVTWNASLRIMQPKPGPLIPLYGLFVLYIFAMGAIYSYRVFKQEQGQKRLQRKYFFVGTVFGLLSAVGSLLPFANTRALWVWIPGALTLIFPGTLTYVVIRHRLWDIRTAFHKTTLWAVTSVGTVVPVYLSLTYGLPYFKENQSTFLLAITIGLYFVLLVIVRKLQPWIDGIFSRRIFSQRQVVDTFITQIRHLQQMKDLAQSLSATLRTKMNISQARILITNASGRYFYDAMDTNSPHGRLILPSQEDSGHTSRLETVSSGEVKQVQNAPAWMRSWLIQQDCAVDQNYLDTTNLPPEQKAEFREFFAQRETLVLLPLLHNQTLIGLIELGDKSNLKPYHSDDFELLERIRSATEVAMNNAQLYQDLESATENLRTLTAGLEQRVQDRTQALEQVIQELEQAYEQVSKLNKVQSRFFTNITHELRTPLTLIIAPLEDQLMNSEDLPGNIKPTLQIMHRQAIRLYSLINDLLDFARIDARELRLKIKEFSIESHIRSVAASFEALAKRRDIELTLEIEEGVSSLYGDSEKLDRVFINLLGNAFKFTPSGGKVIIRLSEEEDQLLCEVEDTGIGIPKEQLVHIFDRFAQVEDGDDRTFEGTGLGLALVRELVHYHQGQIEVESEPEQGTLFRVKLLKGNNHFPKESMERRKERIPTNKNRRASDRDPLSDLGVPTEVAATRSAIQKAPIKTPTQMHVMVQVDGATAQNSKLIETTTSSSPSIASPGSDSEIELPVSVGAHKYSPSEEEALLRPNAESDSTSTIMIVEDNTDMRRYIQSILQPYYNLLVASNGRHALQILERSHPDVIVSDVMMPHISGYELCRHIKHNPETAGIPVILLTANKGSDRTVEGFKAGADDYLTKPFNSRELLARVEVQLKIKKMGHQLALQEKVSLMGILSAGLAHEVNNPANAVRNAVAPLRSLTHDLTGEDQEDATELLDLVLESADRIALLCNDLLGLATTEREGTFPWQLGQALDVTLRILKPRYPHHVHVETDFKHTEAPIGYRSQLNQVLLNLMSNALGAVDPDGTIWLETNSDDETFYLTLKDNGTGIEPKVLHRIFDPLFTTADVGDGTGLGLYLIKRVIDNHGGSIRVESTWDVGTTFFVSFPLKPTENLSPMEPLSKAIATNTNHTVSLPS